MSDTDDSGSLPLVLVTCAAGKTGNATAVSLLHDHSASVRVRAMVRRDDTRAEELRAAGAETLVGNMADIRDVRRAMSGVARAYFVAPIADNSLDYGLNFAVAAAEEGVEHVVGMGQWLASASHPSTLSRRTWLLNQVFAWIPEATYTLINVGFFADNVMSVLPIAAHAGVFPLALGAGEYGTAFISNEDIGRVCAGVLANPAPYVGLTLRPTGPRVLTPKDVAAIFGKVLRRHVVYKASTEERFLKAIQGAGHNGVVPPFMQAQIVHYFREFRAGTFVCGGVTNVVQEVTGSAPEHFETIVRRYAAQNPLVQQSWGNKLQLLWRAIKFVFTQPLDLEEWAHIASQPVLADGGQPCANNEHWKSEHDVDGAFGVPPPRSSSS